MPLSAARCNAALHARHERESSVRDHQVDAGGLVRSTEQRDGVADADFVTRGFADHESSIFLFVQKRTAHVGQDGWHS